MGETVFPAFLSLALEPEANDLEDSALRDDDQAILVRAEGEIAPHLSPREQSILRCLTEGDSNKSIARKIDIAEATVKVHMKAILRKIRVHNRTQAAIWGMNNRSPARTTNTDSPPLVPLRASGLPAPTATISEIKQTDESIQPRATEREANHAGVPRLDRLTRKGGAPLRE